MCQGVLCRVYKSKWQPKNIFHSPKIPDADAVYGRKSQHSKHSVSSGDTVAQALGYLTGRSKKGTRLSISTHTASGCFT